MHGTSNWAVPAARILTKSEIADVLSDLRRRARRSVNTQMNLVIFRLAVCCGLRVSEIAGLKLSNVRLNIAKPVIQIPVSLGKGGKKRTVPLWWDGATLSDLEKWRTLRESQGATGKDYFVCTQSKSSFGNRIHRNGVRQRFIRSCALLGEDREITIHDGRHSFVSHALRGGRTLAEVQQAVGHASIATTSHYLHVAVEDEGEVGDLFSFDL